jgi:hypothetical protein
MKKLLIITLTFLFTASAFANGDGYVRSLLVGRGGNQVFVSLNGAVGGVSCRTRTDWHYFLDLNQDGADEIYSALLAAKLSQQPVYIQSQQKCDSTGQNLELLSYVILK